MPHDYAAMDRRLAAARRYDEDRAMAGAVLRSVLWTVLYQHPVALAPDALRRACEDYDAAIREAGARYHEATGTPAAQAAE